MNEESPPLRQRMIEDMCIRGLGLKSRSAHIRNVKHFAAILGRSPDTATPDDLRSYQLQMTKDGVSASVFNTRIIALRFFFGTTCGREDMKRYMQFHRQPRKLPAVLSVQEVARILASAPGPGLKYRAALGISYGAGLRSAEVCKLKVSDIVQEARLRHDVPEARLRHDDSDRMLIHVHEGKGGKDRMAMLSPRLLDLLRDYWREMRPRAWLFPGLPKVNPILPRQLNRAFHSALDMSGVARPATLHTSRRRRASSATPQLCHASARGEHRCPRHPGAARPFQAQHHGALHPCRDEDDPGHGQSLRADRPAERPAGACAAPAGPGVTRAPAGAGAR